MRNYRNYYGRPARGSYRTRMYEDVDYEDDVPEVLTKEWVKANIPADATHVDIPYGVRILGEDCFYDCKSLKSITIPNSVMSLECCCFFGCDSLKSITIPSIVTSIGDGCFYYCKSLKSITIPSSVTGLGRWCFSYCTSLKSITIPNSVTRFGRGCFKGCVSLENITMPDGVTSLGGWCFEDCASLTSVTIPRSVRNIGDGCFEGCGSLTDVYYGGAESEADGVEVGSYNDPLFNAAWHYRSRGMNERLANRYSRPYYSHNSTRPIREGISYRPYYRSRYRK